MSSDKNYPRYLDIVEMLEHIKIVWGPVALNGTLKKHPKIANFVRDYQKQLIDEIEQEL